VVLCALTTRLLAPAFTQADEHGEDQRHSTRLVPQMWNAVGPSPLLFKSAFRKVRWAHLLAMPPGHLQVIAASLVLQTPASLGKGVVIRRQRGLLPALAFQKRWGIAQVGRHDFERRPGRRGH
jgi:hypothetical protein